MKIGFDSKYKRPEEEIQEESPDQVWWPEPAPPDESQATRAAMMLGGYDFAYRA